MKIAVLRDRRAHEKRVAASAETVKKFILHILVFFHCLYSCNSLVNIHFKSFIFNI